MAKKGRRATEEERIRAVELMANGKSSELVAEFLGVGRSSVFDWQKKYRECGWRHCQRSSPRAKPTVLADMDERTLGAPS